MKARKITLLLATLVMVSLLLVSCKEHPPNGTYEPVGGGMYSSIVIKGNNCTLHDILGMATTYKYTYNKGKVTFVDGTIGLAALEYSDGSLWFPSKANGQEYKRK